MENEQKVLGIDFGTSNSCVAFYDGIHPPVVIVPRVEVEALLGGKVIPSVVSLDNMGNLHAAGHMAQAMSVVAGSTLIDRMKMWIGLSFESVQKEMEYRLRKGQIGYTIVQNAQGIPAVERANHSYTAEDLASYYFTFLINETAEHLKSKMEIDLLGQEVTIIVTYPAYYSQNQVDAIRDAMNKTVSLFNSSAIAPFTISKAKLIPEPLASICAAMYEGKIDANDKYILVVDEGAGTLDVMLVDMERSGGGRDLEAGGVTIGGQEKLGGVDMDNAIFEWIKLKLASSPDPIFINNLDDLEKKGLMKNIELAKISLSKGDTHVAHIFIPKFCRVVELSLEDMATLLSPIIDECVQKVDESLTEIERIERKEHGDNGFERKKLSKIILVGGPTQMRLFRERMKELIPLDPVVGVNPMEYVAIGASVSGTVKFRVPVERTYGLIHKEEESESFEAIVKKNEALPVKRILPLSVEQFTGSIDIEVAQVVTENDYEIVCKKMGRYKFEIPPHRKSYYINFNIDEERKIDVAIHESKELAEQYNHDSLSVTPAIRLTFAREQNYELLNITKPQPDTEPQNKLDPRIRLFYQNSRIIGPRLREAYDKIQISERILNFTLDAQITSRIQALRSNVKDGIDIINGEVISRISNIDQDPETDTLTPELANKFKEIEREVRNSSDFSDLTLNTERLAQQFEGIRDRIQYSQVEVGLLLEEISSLKAKAVEILTLKNNRLNNTSRQEIQELLDTIDSKRIVLEDSNDAIPVISVRGDAYRIAFNKKEELRSMIENI